MQTYIINSSPFFISTNLNDEQTLTSNIILPIDDIPTQVKMISGYDNENNILVYSKEYYYYNFPRLNNDNLILDCGKTYTIWSDPANLPYEFILPDCETFEESDLLPEIVSTPSIS